MIESVSQIDEKSDLAAAFDCAQGARLEIDNKIAERRFQAASPTARDIRRCSNYRRSKRSARASLRSVVSNPSVKRLYTRANVCRA
jgi:hypothetical protein